jgi:succinate-semialdehyde dehydrogenase/glutarate-semialdehyde dehydrogenase
MGESVEQSRKEIEKCALVCRYYAENAATLLADEDVKTEATKSYITFQPIGVIFGSMPWNFPFYQVIRFAIPSLMGKHRSFKTCIKCSRMCFCNRGCFY